MKVLVTGATGGLGRNCVEILSKNYSVLATGRNKNIGAILTQQGIDFAPVDLSKIGEVSTLNLLSVDVVVHCAALATPVGDWEDYYKSNVVATENIVSQAKLSGVKKFIHISTPSVYHNGESRINIKESDPLPTGKTNYAVSKRMAEEKVLSYADESFQVIIIRPRALIGKYDQVILPRILEILNKKRFPMFNGGRALIDVTSIKNVVHAIDCAIKLPKGFNREIYNITNNEPLSVKTLVEMLANQSKISFKEVNLPLSPVKGVATLLEWFYRFHLLPQPPKLSRYSVDLLSLDQTLNIDKALTELKYTPSESISDAVTSFLEWKRHETI